MTYRQQVELEPAWLLHRYAYRDSSLIIELFTERHGRVALVARGARRPKARGRAVLQPFAPLLVSWISRRELGTLTAAEAAARPVPLAAKRLLSGWYLNELVLRLFERNDPHPEVFHDYTETLGRLAHAEHGAPCLRRFEKRLLDALGYGLNLTREVDSGAPVVAEARYEYRLEAGPVRIGAEAGGALVVGGATLLGLADGELDQPGNVAEARRLLRAALDLYLGTRPLHSREVLHALGRLRAEAPRGGERPR